MSPQFSIAEMKGGKFFGIYETVDKDRGLARLISASSNLADAHTINAVLNHCSQFAPTNSSCFVQLKFTKRELEAEFGKTTDIQTCYRIYEQPHGNNELLRVIGIAWYEEDANFITSALNHCCGIACTGYIRGPSMHTKLFDL
jgi:hypothetical protein